MDGVQGCLRDALLVYPQAEIEVQEHGILFQLPAPPAPPRGVVYLQRPSRR